MPSSFLDTPRAARDVTGDDPWEDSPFVRRCKALYRRLGRMVRRHVSFPAEVGFLTVGTAFWVLWSGLSYDYVLKRRLFRFLAKARVLNPFVNYGGLVVLFWAVVAYLRFQRWASIDTSTTATPQLPDAARSPSPPFSSVSSLSPSSVSSPSTSPAFWMAQRIRVYYKASMSMYRAVYALLLTLFMRQSLRQIKTDITALIALDTTATEREMLRFKPPSLEIIKRMIGPYRQLLSPQFVGWENVPVPADDTPPLLFVCNHTILGFDFPILLLELFRKKGIFIRALADHSHFQIPGNSDLLKSFGAVDGTRRNVDLLFEKHESLIVYPGGAREVFKRKRDAKYALFWEDKVGFARMAIKHGATIVPVTNYGSESMLTVAADLPLGWLPVPFLFGSDRTLPLPLPSGSKVDRLWFKFGTPISTAHLKGKENDTEAVEAIKEETKRAVEAGIAELRALAHEQSLVRQEKKEQTHQKQQQQKQQQQLHSKI
jgi:1-acyl-sn-glycerol-3-phosphate acyltransferase